MSALNRKKPEQTLGVVLPKSTQYIGINVGKTKISHPQFHHFYRWYVYHSQSWVVYHCFTHIV